MSEPTDMTAVAMAGGAPASDATAADDQPEKLESQTSQPDKSSLKESIISHNLERDHSDTRAKPFIWALALTAALGGLIFGYDIGGAGATFVMDGFKYHFGWACAPDDYECVPKSQRQIDIETGLINGLFGTGAAFGALFAPLLFNNKGRKPTINFGAIAFTIGAALQAAAVSMPMLYIPRLLSGFGIGMLSMCSPVLLIYHFTSCRGVNGFLIFWYTLLRYIAECAPESHRGQLATLWQLAITSGIVLVSILNIWLADWQEGWRISYGGNIVFSLALVGLLTIMPESPHFLVSNERFDDAREALGKTRFEDQIDWELDELKLEAKNAREEGVANWGEVFDDTNKKMRTRVRTGVLLQSFQQLSGINAIMFYAPNILQDFFGSKGSIYGTLALNIINFFATFITIFSIERFGRVFLLFTGGLVMLVALIPTAVLASVDSEEGSVQAIGIGVTVFCALYVIGFAYSWGPVVWVVCAEMFPMRERGKATSLTTFSNWFWTCIVGAVFPIASTASLAGCFGFFAAVVFVATTFVYLFLPETANLTAPEIDEQYLTHKATVPRKKWN
eukprot:CCRYP_009747-RE/>CCRYP_009747-RE protein AED:0.11 eAED:0.11 QI:189/0.90/0.91/1/0.81/0.75/12/500/562